MIDLWQSRRTKFIECKYWSQITDKNIAKFSEIAYNREPTGSFKASITGSYTEENQTIENAFMYKKVTVVIETTDNVKDLERNDVIEMKGEYYRVSDIQRKPVSKQEQYLNDPDSYTTFISLRR